MRSVGLALLLITVSTHALAVLNESYAHPFGITPKVITYPADAHTTLHSWQFHFNSLEEFVETVRQPSFQLMTSGKTAVVYYAVFRIQPDIYLYVTAFVKDEKSNGGYWIYGKDRNDSPLLDETHNPKLAEVLDATIKYSSTGKVSAGDWPETLSATFYGYAAKVKNDYHGPITINAQNWNEGRDKVRSSNSVTVDW